MGLLYLQGHNFAEQNRPAQLASSVGMEGVGRGFETQRRRPISHPCRRLAGEGLLDQRGHVRDWAPPGWYWEVLSSGGHSLMRSQPVVDPNYSGEVVFTLFFFLFTRPSSVITRLTGMINTAQSSEPEGLKTTTHMN